MTSRRELLALIDKVAIDIQTNKSKLAHHRSYLSCLAKEHWFFLLIPAACLGWHLARANLRLNLNRLRPLVRFTSLQLVKNLAKKTLS